MIEESYVSFETAKLLKERGFSEECSRNGYYVVNKYSTGVHWNPMIYNVGDTTFEYSINNVIPKPTQQMAMRWLREEHSLDIITFHEKLPNDCYWCRIETYPHTEFEQEPVHKTYEQACEAAIKYCLINLVKANAEG